MFIFCFWLNNDCELIKITKIVCVWIRFNGGNDRNFNDEIFVEVKGFNFCGSVFDFC